MDGLGGKEDDLDFMNDLGNELNEDSDAKKNKKKRKKDDVEAKADEEEADWGDDLDHEAR